MNDSIISRRRLMGGGGLSIATAMGLFTLPNESNAQAQTVFQDSGSNESDRRTEEFEASRDAAYDFLDAMMDAYASGRTLRLIQSYSDQSGLLATGFTYDNAVAIQAYLARDRPGDLARAEVLGKSLIHAQATNFPINDGRFAQGYFVNAPDNTGAYITPAAYPFYFYTSAVGDQAWAGMALAKLYARTNDSRYLTAALKVANWIVTNTYDTQGPGGYRFGTNINQNNQSVPSPNGKSTEHNIDTYAFFTMLSQLTRRRADNGASWSSLAQHAFTFVQAMFNSSDGFFWTGTNSDQVTIFYGNIPEDVQTWSYLAFLNRTYEVSLDWVTANLASLDTPSCPNSALKTLGNLRIQGETFASASLASNPQGSDPHAVWLEGTAHTAAALLIHKRLGDGSNPDHDALAYLLLENMRLAQSKLGTGQTVNGMALTPDQGVVASTGNLDTGFGFSYFPNLHIGATGWYVIALQATNPFQLAH